jgi:hypothetical protein
MSGGFARALMEMLQKRIVRLIHSDIESGKQEFSGNRKKR